MECVVLKKTAGLDEALEPIIALPQPVCIVIARDSYNLAHDRVYQQVAAKIGQRIPIMCQGDVSWAVEDMLRKGKNAILVVNGNVPGDFHKTISGLRIIADQLRGSVAGIRIESALRSGNFTANSEINSHVGNLDCLITVTCN